MPNAPKTPLRNFRAPDDEWLTAKAALLARGRNITDELRGALRFHAGPVRIERHNAGSTYWVVLDDRTPEDQPTFDNAEDAVTEAVRRYRQLHQDGQNHDDRDN